jgi:hypothetical protein
MNTLIRYVFLLGTAGLLVACGGSNRTTSSDISETVADAREAHHEILDTNEKEEAFVDAFDATEEEIIIISDEWRGLRDEGIQSPEEVQGVMDTFDALDNPEALTYCTLGGGECKEDENCAPSDDGYALVCRKAGSTPAGGRCKVHEDCAKGLACAIYGEDIVIASLCVAILLLVLKAIKYACLGMDMEGKPQDFVLALIAPRPTMVVRLVTDALSLPIKSLIAFPLVLCR